MILTTIKMGMRDLHNAMCSTKLLMLNINYAILLKLITNPIL